MKKTFEIIRDLREDRDLKQKDVAAYLKMSRTTYNHYELGHTALNEDIIIKLSDFYQVTPNVILGYKNTDEIKDVKILKLLKLIEKENIDIDSLILLIQSTKKLFKKTNRN
jgi:transcriptional regulator with XRE-family HTH domain